MERFSVRNRDVFDRERGTNGVYRLMSADDAEQLYRHLVETHRQLAFYKSRVEAIERLFRKMPEPWITLIADILANGAARWWGEGEGVVEPPNGTKSEAAND